jgi:hypothetical protein
MAKSMPPGSALAALERRILESVAARQRPATPAVEAESACADQAEGGSGLG